VAEHQVQVVGTLQMLTAAAAATEKPGPHIVQDNVAVLFFVPTSGMTTATRLLFMFVITPPS
jgi:hypothetical protein